MKGEDGFDRTMRVSANTAPHSLGGAIADEVRDRGRAYVQGIGAAAINQAVKGIAVARGYMAPRGVDLACIPGFAELNIGGQERTAIMFEVFARPGSVAPGEAADRKGSGWTNRWR